VCDRSHAPVKKRSSAAARKRKQRARLKAGGKHRIEAWITQSTSDLVESFAARTGSDFSAVLELVLERATPLYLREVTRRLDEIMPLLESLEEYERFGIVPSPQPALPIRINCGEKSRVFDAHECFKLVQKIAPLLSQLGRYGLSKEVLLAQVRSRGWARHAGQHTAHHAL